VKTTDAEAKNKSIEWLETSPPLKELCAVYPGEWEVVERELAMALSSGKADDVQSFLKRLATAARRRDAANTKASEKLLLNMVRYRMAHAALRQHCISVATGVEEGTVRFNLLNGLIAQKLLFSHDLVRKPVSMFWFRLIWPLIRQKRFLMPLVQPKGIYCFYSRELIVSLAGLIGGRTCLEVAAGDGTLTRFLSRQGVQVTATDDYSWSHAVMYPDDVVKRDAKDALSLYAPEVVICSWPPAQNSFERQIFRTRSVQLYIAIGSRHKFAAGNWSDYEEQTSFSFQEAPTLSALVLPPELDTAVYLFRRK
jgi:hypothetical protein